MYKTIRLLLSVLLLSMTTAAHAQSARTGPTNEELQRAAARFAQSDWKGVLEAYSAIAQQYPQHALSRFRIGVAQVGLGRFAEGEANIRRGEALGMPPGPSAYRLAQAMAEQKMDDSAIVSLIRAARGGLSIPRATLEADPHFARVIAHPRWSEAMDSVGAVAQPCKYDRRFRELDFWVGDWDVRATGSPPVGPAARNTVTIEDDGCVVTEHWVAPGGSIGQSFNLFDRSVGQWRQTWVDNSGGQHDYRGGLKDGNMVYAGDTPAPGGALGRIPTRLTFFHISADSVRQFSETSPDSGRTWAVAYDLIYVRRREAKEDAAASGVATAAPTTMPTTSPGSAAGLTSSDRAAILALDSLLVRAWLADDTSAVLGLFSPAAVLLPPASTPVEGLAAIRAFWWPVDGSHTRIGSFRRTIAEVQGTRGMAWVRGTASLRWTYTKNGATKTQSSRSTDVMLYTTDAAGRRRIARHMWSALP